MLSSMVAGGYKGPTRLATPQDDDAARGRHRAQLWVGVAILVKHQGHDEPEIKGDGVVSCFFTLGDIMCNICFMPSIQPISDGIGEVFLGFTTLLLIILSRPSTLKIS